MSIMSRTPTVLFLSAMLTVPAWGSLSAQRQELVEAQESITVHGSSPADLSGLAEGPEIEGFISARSGKEMQVSSSDGSSTAILISDATQIRASGGLFGLNRTQHGADALLNGLPVTVKTVQWGGGLVASQIKFKNDDLETATMIRSGTEQRFGEQGAAIVQNAAATEALRGRMGDIDQYNLKSTTNVYFDTGKAVLSTQARNDLCATAAEAEAMENALILVVGYADSTGGQEFNQQLSERRAGSVVNYLQQACGWKPFRMLTPTGMAEADPLASNETAEGRAQNRRVSVNVLVSKAIDGL